MALGAQRRRVIWMVLREVLLLTVAGIAISVPASLAGSRLVWPLLFGMQTNDPLGDRSPGRRRILTGSEYVADRSGAGFAS